jgi:hypothetical protein
MASILPLPIRRVRAAALLLCAPIGTGCGGAPDAFEAPVVATAAAAAEAIELYVRDRSGALSREELRHCPGILTKLTAYDANVDGAVSQREIESRLGELFEHGAGGTQLNILVTFQGRPLAGADIVLEPEPYLGDGVQPATGKTNGSGAAQMGIPAAYLPSHLQRLKAVHYGTYKVRVTHASTLIPEKYNVKTEIGYETEVGNPFLRVELE